MNKNKIILPVVVIAIAVGIGVYEAYSEGNQISAGPNHQESQELKRVTITPKDSESAHKIRSMVDVRHEFGDKFSANVTSEQINELMSLAEVSEVAVYTISAKPICGDSVLHPSEECGEPGLDICPDNEVCQSCKCVSTQNGSTRTCEPDNQVPWGIEKVNGGSGGEGAVVTVLDTGVLEEHLDLDVKVCKNATLKGIKNECEDDHSHGTHVAGTIVGNGGEDRGGIYGVAPEAELWMIKVCDMYGYCYGDDIAAGIKYAANRGTDIISMSFYGDSEEGLVTEAVKYAYSKGVLLIASAGNSGPSFGSIVHPASMVEVVAVGAIDMDENVAAFSSRGVNDGDFIIEDSEVEFAAPGLWVESTDFNGCYSYKSGTSMSAPHASGLAAKLWQGDASSTRTYLQDLAKLYDLDVIGDDPASGFGLPIAP